MIIKLMKYGTLIGTRDAGNMIRQEINGSSEFDEIIILDFSGVSQMTHSCADEAFGKLIDSWGVEKVLKKIKFKNVDETTSLIIKYAMAQRISKQSTR